MINSTFANVKMKEFEIEELFNVKGSKTTSLSDLKAKKETKYKYPYITTKSVNNGIEGFFKYYSEKGNVLTVDSATIGYVSYQKNNFSASDHVEILEPKFMMNKYLALFFVQTITSACNKKYGYGYKFSQKRIKRQKLLLPTKNNIPHWSFMENFIKEKEKIFITEYENYISKKENLVKNNIEDDELDDINSKDWKEFEIKKIFTNVQRGKRLKKEDHISGRMPYISSSALKNGVDNFISNRNNARLFSDCLTLANSGSVGTCFYQPFEFVASDHVTKLENSNFNKYVYLFIATILSKLSGKYSFNREINNKRLEKEKIILPINDTGDPDYVFMEKYMEKLENEKIRKYLEYIEKKI